MTETTTTDTLTVPVDTGRDDAWEWEARYTDGSALPEYTDDGTQHAWKDIDQDRLAVFVLVPTREGLPYHALKVGPTMRPIFFRRRSMTVNVATDERTPNASIHVLGMQTTVKGTNVATFTYLFEDNSIVVTDDPNVSV